ncbi:MAG TPA: helix-turn-helix domain-containing protein, partial [Tepidisphaeraceae bacterium]|nr:helix-turn-helix domain-containing protein [Tepidisphaeraceae bacterium]
MSHAVTTALAPMMKAAAVAISAPPKPPASTSPTSLALPANAPDDLECSDLSPPQLAYLRALISGKTITAAAEEAGVARKTVYRWQSNPRF